MWRCVVTVYLTPALVVAPCLAASPSPKLKGGPRALTLSQFVERLKIEAHASQLPAVFTKLMDFPADSTWRSFSASASEAADGAMRGAHIVYSKAGGGEEASPMALFWVTRLESDRKSETYDYRTTLDGTLEAAFRVDGETDESGADIRGKGKLTKLDVGATEVRERFQHEVLDFWLKGKGRKRSGAKTTPVKRSATP